MSLSVLMANYNHGRYLKESLRAILDQSVRPDEIVFVDDSSTDDSLSIVHEMARSEPILKILKNERNSGVITSFQRAFDNSIGDYVYFASADDRVLPGFLAQSLALLRRFPQAGLCCCFHSTMDGDSGEIHENPTWWLEKPGYISPQALTCRVWGGGIPGHTAIVRRDAFIEAGGYLPNLRWHADWFASLVAAFRHGICFIPQSLALSRVYETSYSAAGRHNASEQSQVLNEILTLLLSPEYSDVLPYFQKSGALSPFGCRIVQAAVDNGLHRNSRALGLLSQVREHKAHHLSLQRPRFPSGVGAGSRCNELCWKIQRLRSPILRWPLRIGVSAALSLKL